MSTPILYIVVPGLAAILLFFLRGQPKLTVRLTFIFYLILGLIAFFQEFGQVLKLGLISIELKTSINILGRSFILDNPDRYFLVIMSMAFVFWLGGMKNAGIQINVIPYMMAALASLTAAIAVDPFLYSAIFIEIAVLLSMPILIHSGEPLSNGVLRFLIYQSISMPLILLGGWFVAGNQASPSDIQQLAIAGFFLSTGFAFWLGLFPFHSWVPQLSEDVHPYIGGFLLTFFPQAVLLLMIDFVASVSWIRESTWFGPIFQIIGTIMLATSALWSLFEKNPKRILGYLVLFETGTLLLLIGLYTSSSLQSFYLALIPRIIGLLLFSLSISILWRDKITGALSIDGKFWEFPFASIGLVVSMFSIVGLPPFGEFPFKYLLISSLGETSAINLIWVIIGFIVMLIPLFTILRKLFLPTLAKARIIESLSQILLLCSGFFLLLLIGIFPRVLQGMVTHLIIYLPAGR
jgi:formate hydrogenlyase subunit 3/multisubunit Na+/H+ antiporter MnhD subunit